MKQFFILFISMFTATTVVKAADVTREIELTQSVYSIEISHDMDVVLTESTEATIRITGEEKATKAVLYDVTKGRLKLLSKKGSLKKALFHGLWAFFRTYFIRAGFLDGKEGVMLAIANAECTRDFKN